MELNKQIIWTGLTAVSLLTIPYAVSADDRGSYRRGLKNEIHQDRRDLQETRQELQSDRQDLRQDRREYRQDRRAGASSEELARDRAEIRESLDDLRSTRRERERDQRELNRDRAEYDWRYRDRERNRWWDPSTWW